MKKILSLLLVVCMMSVSTIWTVKAYDGDTDEITVDGYDITIEVTIQNNKKIVYLHKRNFEISNSRHADEKSTNWSHAMLSRGTKNAS